MVCCLLRVDVDVGVAVAVCAGVLLSASITVCCCCLRWCVAYCEYYCLLLPLSTLIPGPCSSVDDTDALGWYIVPQAREISRFDTGILIVN